MSKVSNPFEIEGEAQRYHAFRPRYHHIPLNLVQAHVGEDFDLSLDVACGTGHSTHAISKISKKVIGCDSSESMLNQARNSFAIQFVKGSAESLPFENSAFDFINISMGFHWVDQKRFLTEAQRVLKKGGYLAIDNYGFLGNISDDPLKQQAHLDLFEQYLPPATRRSGYPTEELLKETSLNLLKEIKYDHRVTLDSHEFINLLMTWSNFQMLGESQKPTTAQKMKEIYNEIFAGGNLDLGFGGKTVLYQFSETTR